MIINNNNHRIRKVKFLSNKVEINSSKSMTTINVNKLNSPQIVRMVKIKNNNNNKRNGS